MEQSDLEDDFLSLDDLLQEEGTAPKEDTEDFLTLDQLKSEKVPETSRTVQPVTEQTRSGIADVALQTGRGLASLFTWPADLVKALGIGQSMADLDELEYAHALAGKPFDRESYNKGVMNASEYFPTQETAENMLETYTGPIEPQTLAGEIAGQAAPLAKLTPGSAVKKLLTSLAGTAATQVAKAVNVPEPIARVGGDLLAMYQGTKKKFPKEFSGLAEQNAKTAEKYTLPLWEMMVRDKAPVVKGRISQKTRDRLAKELHTSSANAIEKVISQEIPIKNLRDRGVNLSALYEEAYKKTAEMASKSPSKINSKPILDKINQKIQEIKSKAPSPSDAQKTAISILENERNALALESQLSPEKLIQQHINYNANLKNIYRKPEFSGREEAVKNTYGFLKKELLDAMERDGSHEISSAFKASNKIFSEAHKLMESERLLSKVFVDGKYNPTKLSRLLQSNSGKTLRRNIGERAVREIEDIAHYGSQAERTMKKLIESSNTDVRNYLGELGKLAMFVLPGSLSVAGAGAFAAKPIAQAIQGRILTSPAQRTVYRKTLKNLAAGNLALMRNDLKKLETMIDDEYGSVDDAIADLELNQ